MLRIPERQERSFIASYTPESSVSCVLLTIWLGKCISTGESACAQFGMSSRRLNSSLNLTHGFIVGKNCTDRASYIMQHVHRGDPPDTISKTYRRYDIHGYILLTSNSSLHPDLCDYRYQSGMPDNLVTNGLAALPYRSYKICHIYYSSPSNLVSTRSFILIFITSPTTPSSFVQTLPSDDSDLEQTNETSDTLCFYAIRYYKDQIWHL